MLNRRSFLSSSFASSLAVGAGVAWRGNLWAQLESLPSKLPERSLFDQNEDAYWHELRKQFLIPPDEIYLNNGTVGSSPAPVLLALLIAFKDRAQHGRRARSHGAVVEVDLVRWNQELFAQLAPVGVFVLVEQGALGELRRQGSELRP